MNPEHEIPPKSFLSLSATLAAFTFVVLLSASHVADGDLWAKLALGASVWLRGEVPHHDSFAFTPVLPVYIDHEWGAGTIFFGLLKFFGPSSLMLLKVALFFGAVLTAFFTGRKSGTSPAILLWLAIPAGLAVLPGYIPTLRSHTFTYCFFGLILLCLEEIKQGRKWAVVTAIGVMLIWTNVHGGVAAGLGTMGVYALDGILSRRHPGLLLATAFGSFAVTFINPYGLDYWRYLIPALQHARPRILEWRPLPFFENDAYLGFRFLFVLVVLTILFSWKSAPKKSRAGLIMLGLTACLAWRSRRHAPFFGVAALAFAGPFLQTSWEQIRRRLPERLRESGRRWPLLLATCGLMATLVAAKFLPQASWDILAPVGHDPVREADILSLAEAKGNLAVPFGWGSYAAWRLHPNIKISHDGRYEAAYPESTFELNNAFFEKRGTNWDALLKQFTVDFVVLDLQHETLRPEDLRDRGYELIWLHKETSALLALNKHAPLLRGVATNLPPTTINPLDARIPEKWWK